MACVVNFHCNGLFDTHCSAGSITPANDVVYEQPPMCEKWKRYISVERFITAQLETTKGNGIIARVVYLMANVCIYRHIISVV